MPRAKIRWSEFGVGLAGGRAYCARRWRWFGNAAPRNGAGTVEARRWLDLVKVGMGIERQRAGAERRWLLAEQMWVAESGCWVVRRSGYVPVDRSGVLGVRRPFLQFIQAGREDRCRPPGGGFLGVAANFWMSAR